MTADSQSYDAASYVTSSDRSVHQSDARIFHRGDCAYDEVESVEAARLEATVLRLSLRLQSGAGATLELRVLAEDALRCCLRLDDVSSAIVERSDMIVAWPDETPSLRLDETAEGWSLLFGRRRLHVERDPFRLWVEEVDGRRSFCTEHYMLAGSPLVGALGFRRRGDTVEPYLSWSIRNDERFFGLGEKWNSVEKRGTRATVWASDTCGSNSNDLAYKSIPYLLSSRGWGVFLHSSYRSFWEIGTFSYVSGSLCSEDDKLDAVLFFGDGLKQLIERYTAITGRPGRVPDWAFGLWMSRCQYENQEEAEEAMRGLRERDIPADVIHLDPLWMQTHYYFKIGVDACDFQRNVTAFPDLPGLWKKWRADGFKTCLWVNPYIPEGTPIYDEAEAGGYLLRSTKGGLARLSHGEPVGMVDFTNPDAREWWKGKLKTQLEDGAAVLKPDYGDRVPEDALFADGRTGRELHNMFLFWFTECCYQACQEVHGYGLVWRRAGYIGSQRYPGTWAGDTRSTWEEMAGCLRGGLSAGFNGDAFWSGDVGGFTGEPPTPELYIRWAQWGLLSSLCRFHGANCPREPWFFGEQAVGVVRRYAKLRYRLLPYLKRCAEDAYERGLPIMRHLRLECPEEPGVEHIDDQFMLGPSILVAPVMEAGAAARQVYFPAGEWCHLEDESECYEGSRWHTVSAPLERLPVFRRRNTELDMLSEAPSWIADGHSNMRV